jgi:hypothetical protein
MFVGLLVSSGSFCFAQKPGEAFSFPLGNGKPSYSLKELLKKC